MLVASAYTSTDSEVVDTAECTARVFRRNHNVVDIMGRHIAGCEKNPGDL